MRWQNLPARNSESVCLQPSPVLLPILLTWSTLHLCWTGLSHLWWRNGLVCLSFGHNKSWGSSPRQGRCFWITWCNTPLCDAKYPASTGNATCAFPPALLLHGAYLEPSFTSWNFNLISFLKKACLILLLNKSLWNQQRINFIHLLQCIHEDNLKIKTRNNAILTMKKEFWDWKPGFTGEKILHMLIVLMMGQRTAAPPNLNSDCSFSAASRPGGNFCSSALLFWKVAFCEWKGILLQLQ